MGYNKRVFILLLRMVIGGGVTHVLVLKFSRFFPNSKGTGSDVEGSVPRPSCLACNGRLQSHPIGVNRKRVTVRAGRRRC